MAINTKRLDRLISEKCEINRKKVRLILAQNRVYVDGKLATDVDQIVDQFSFVIMDDEVLQARLRLALVSITSLESKINGSFKDIATLIDTYEAIKEKNGIDDWDEESYEREEKRHHVRRSFELMYRNLMDGGRASTSTIEYMQQYGVHPQVGHAEVSGYIASVNQRIANHQLLHSNDLEEFLDKMADKYYKNADKTTERIFGKTDILNTGYMNLLPKQEETEETKEE